MLQTQLHVNWPSKSDVEYACVSAEEATWKAKQMKLEHLHNPVGAILQEMMRDVLFRRNTKPSVGTEKQACGIVDEAILLD